MYFKYCLQRIQSVFKISINDNIVSCSFSYFVSVIFFLNNDDNDIIKTDLEKKTRIDVYLISHHLSRSF